MCSRPPIFQPVVKYFMMKRLSVKYMKREEARSKSERNTAMTKRQTVLI